MTNKKRFERIYADVDVFCRDHNAKGISQLIEKEDYDKIVDLLNDLHYENYNLELHSKSQSKAYHKLLDSFTRLKRKNKELKEENEQLKNHIKTLQNNTKRLENQNIETYNLIKEAYKNERTALGRSVLKQLIDGVIK